MEMNPKSITYK